MGSSAAPTWIALFRGINVGGRNSLPMAALRELLASLGCEGVRSYIQSGNVVLTARGERSELVAAIRDAVHAEFGFRPELVLLEAGEFEGIEQRNPFPDAVAEPRQLHTWFLESVPADPDLDRLASLAAAGERFELCEREFFLHAPGGIGRSKLAAKVESCLGVAGTARNWRTVTRVLELVRQA